MSYFSKVDRPDVEASKFFINIENELGLSYKKQRAALLAVALSKPSEYYTLRSSLIEHITTAQVRNAYKIFWQLLKNGVIGEKPAEYKNGSETCYLKPDLPEHLINKFASRVAATLEEICEEAVNLILPEDFLKMAQEKQKNILGARGEI
jgi:hypothetical protein